MPLYPETLEILQPAGEDKIYFRCNSHNYWGQTQAPIAIGCSACWAAHYFVMFGKYHTEQGEDEVFEAVLKRAAESARAGQWDVKLFEKPRAEKETPS